MQEETKNNVYTIHRQLQNMLANSLVVIGLSWSLDQKKNGTEPDGSWDRMEEEMIVIQYFVLPMPLREENYEAKRGRNKSIHFKGSNENIDLLLRTVHGLQDPQNQDARSSWEPSSNSNKYGKTCNRTMDHRIAGAPLSAVEPQNTTRENKVKSLIEKFENHKIRKFAYSGFETDGED